MLHHSPAASSVPNYTKDLASGAMYQFFQNYFILLQIVLGVLLYLLGGWSFRSS